MELQTRRACARALSILGGPLLELILVKSVVFRFIQRHKGARGLPLYELDALCVYILGEGERDEIKQIRKCNIMYIILMHMYLHYCICSTIVYTICIYPAAFGP